MSAGIYRIDGPNRRFYIGSTKDLGRRKSRHWRMLRRGDHSNVHLQRAWNRYGEDAFSFAVLETVADTDRLLEREQFWLDLLRATLFGYNIAAVAGAPTKGLKASEETRAKMSASAKGKKHGPMSEEQKAHYSALYKGRKLSEETRQRMSASRTGRKFSEETRAKIAAVHAGKPKSEAHKAALAAANVGKQASEETKAKMSATHRRRVELGLHNWSRSA